MTTATPGVTGSLSRAEMRAEWAACAIDPLYFIDHYCRIYDPGQKEWIPFRLWRAQIDALPLLERHKLLIVLKARQLGFSWWALAYLLWLMQFWPKATVLLFSKREKEAIYLLGRERLRGMHARLPDWLRVPATGQDAATVWGLANGSVAHAFPTNAGDSYTASAALVDEADLVPDLDDLLARVQPTVDAGGQLLLLSRPDKSRPESAFKRIYRAARAGQNGWAPLFLPWDAHPGRNPAWYAEQRADVLARTGSLDDLHEQYPETEAEALSPRTLDKRLAPAWLEACYRPAEPWRVLPFPETPAIPGLEVYAPPEPGGRYAVGCDPAEGNPQSDDSALCVLDVRTGEECCFLSGKVPPELLGRYAAEVCRWYHRAGLLVERNNHGHLTLASARQAGAWLLAGLDGRPGWLSTTLGNAALYDRLAESVRSGEVIIRSLATFSQLASIDGRTLAAPPSQHDDRADAFALANAARAQALRPPPGKQPEAGRNVAETLRGAWLT